MFFPQSYPQKLGITLYVLYQCVSAKKLKNQLLDECCLHYTGLKRVFIAEL